MKQKWIIVGLFFLIIPLFQTDKAEAYGWGYKKNTSEQIPDVGKYEEIIDGQLAFYADKQTQKDVYLTFDNGYEAGYTEGILNILQQEKVPATFFLTGHYIEEESSLVKRMVEDGHIIGNHSYHHPDFTTMSKTEIKKELQLVEDAVAKITKQTEMKYVRPPRGTFNEQT